MTFPPPYGPTIMNLPRVVSQAEWLEARKPRDSTFARGMEQVGGTRYYRT